MLKLDETEAFLGEVSYSGPHQASIEAVLAGEVDASAIDSHVLAVETRHRPELATDLRVIEAPARLQVVVQDALCSRDQADDAREHLDEGVIRRFVAIDDRAYDDIRAKFALVTAAWTRPRARAPRLPGPTLSPARRVRPGSR